MKLNLRMATIHRPNGGAGLSGRSIRPQCEKRSAFRQDLADGHPLEVSHHASYFTTKSFDIE
jgi:hypothetical protein